METGHPLWWPWRWEALWLEHSGAGCPESLSQVEGGLAKEGQVPGDKAGLLNMPSAERGGGGRVGGVGQGASKSASERQGRGVVSWDPQIGHVHL